MTDPLADSGLLQNRRQFFGRSSTGIGVAALASLLNPGLFGGEKKEGAERIGGLEGIPHFAPKAKRVIYLLQSGAPSQVDLLDYKPTLEKLHMKQLPAEIRDGQRLTGMTAGQRSFPLVKSPWKFRRYGQSGGEVSDLFPQVARRVDDLCIIRSMHGTNVAHGAAVLKLHTGSGCPYF